MENSGFFLNTATLDALIEIVNMQWFYYLELIGTGAFAISGFLKAYQNRYDYFGALVLASLPTVGGGILRDILVGGDRYPLFIFSDPAYFYIIFIVVIVGSIFSKTWSHSEHAQQRLTHVLNLFDTVGLATFTIVGAKVALVAQLDWFWVILLATITCAGGGIMTDIVIGQEPDVLKGELYEEVAAIGGLLLLILLWGANFFAQPFYYVIGSIIFVLLFVFFFRLFIIKTGVRSPVLGGQA